MTATIYPNIPIWEGGPCLENKGWMLHEYVDATPVFKYPPCNLVLRIEDNNTINYETAVTFNGGSKVDYGYYSNCGGSDARITKSRTYAYGYYGLNLFVDVWGARKDSEWTSSVEVKIYGHNWGPYAGLALNMGTIIHPYGENWNDISLPHHTGSSPYCPTELAATITITDHGVITLA